MILFQNRDAIKIQHIFEPFETVLEIFLPCLPIITSLSAKYALILILPDVSPLFLSLSVKFFAIAYNHRTQATALPS